jgi:hypothetical protein
MSYYRNVQNDGIWEVGGTYTFEVDERSYDSENEGGSISLGVPVFTGFWYCNPDILAGGEPSPPPPPVYLQETNPNYPNGTWLDYPIYEYGGVSCSPDGTNKTIGFGLYYSSDSLDNDVCSNTYPTGNNGGTIFFDNNNENFEGAIEGIEILSIEELEDGWNKYTVKVSEDTEAGDFYIKGREYDYNWAFA